MYHLDVLKIVRLLQAQNFYGDGLFSIRMSRDRDLANVFIQANSNPRFKKNLALKEMALIQELEKVLPSLIEMFEENKMIKRKIQDRLKKASLLIRVLGTESPRHFEFIIDNPKEIDYEQLFALAIDLNVTFGIRMAA